MSFTSILIILGCLVAGYWIVSSVMGPGVDVMDEGRKAEERKGRPPGPAQPTGSSPKDTGPRIHVPMPRDDGPMRDWHIVLDVAPDASRTEIQAAMKRRLAQAEASGDRMAVARIARAAEAGLAQLR
jgi:hypothetical protein